jgi:hypothetical protein
MKSKELIERLQKLDPTGECQVYSEGDIYTAIKLPWYYDGRPGILIKDLNKDKDEFNILGLRQHSVEDGDKIYLQCYTLDDAASDEMLSGDTRIIEGDDYFLEKYEKYKEGYNEINERLNRTPGDK